MKLINGDCLIELKTLPDNSIDSICTDPPYELGFMGKKWDNTGIAYNVNLWKECLRVLKPGGHLLSFGGSRTYHRMACAIEDAGFTIRDQIMWVYGSGFPKSLNVGKSVNALEIKEWSKIDKAIDNIDKKNIIEVWKTNLNNVNNVESLLQKNKTEVGIVIPKNVSVQENVTVNTSQKNLNLSVSFVAKNLKEAQATNTKINIVLQNVEAEIKQSLELVKSVEKLLQDQNLKSWNIFTADANVREWLKENIMVSHKVDEALKILRGNQKYSSEEITSVLCVALIDILKLTILNQSKTFQNLDTKSQMECVYAINVTITESTMECLISNTVDILKGKAVDKLQGNERDVVGKGLHSNIHSFADETKYSGTDFKPDITKGTSPYEGWGTAMKPSNEPIVLARKPLSEKTVALNVLKWGTGGLNIDGCRVEAGSEITDRQSKGGNKNKSNSMNDLKEIIYTGSPQGRFPANFIHDGSPEVVSLFPETKSGKMGPQHTRHTDGSPNGIYGKFDVNHELGETYGDSGSAARFFMKCKFDNTCFLCCNPLVETNNKEL